MRLTGMHHVTAVSADASANHAFYTGLLGMRLVKKTVNQDDTSAYHLFFGDGAASPGSDITFFEWPVPPEKRGTNAVSRTALRVPTRSLAWWKEHLDSRHRVNGGIRERDGRQCIDFEDGEGQRLTLLGDDSAVPLHPWEDSPVPAEHQIVGLGPPLLTVADLARLDLVLTRILDMRPARRFADATGHMVHVYEMGEGGAAAELHAVERRDLPVSRQGAGAVHHIAFRTPDEESYAAWDARLRQIGVPSSGPVDRYYFRSLYFREPNGILFEIATDGPGFAVDEPMATLGESLALPPFLESRRAQIEAGLKPLARSGA